MKTFIEAIENAQKMEGMLNYIAEFDLTVNFKDKSSAHYHLSLGGETEGEGLLVSLSNTLQGFRIQKEDTKLLRERYRQEFCVSSQGFLWNCQYIRP
ncbi:hypothetical protein E2L07_19765 [Halalkalibacterium halodurans]|uniref:hypothetical protein n=1 Tax=Halalkalibacterium halodurans TaxID=86665 RepID=UPI001067763D|nr:hypothetical protein [Halalkalibacterium halodurans]TES46035.1 hypothetical protein E2L07_19765 [Halalkalibacterium halodurans]